MKTVIIEDEKLAAERLERLLGQVAPHMDIAARIGSVREGIRWFTQNSCDLIFLDIQLSDGLSFSIFEQVPVNTPVILTTAYDQYAIRAFQLNSIAYLLKPVRKNELIDSLNKLNRVKTTFHIDFERLYSAIEGRNPEYKQRFLIQIGTKIKKIEVNDIAYFFARDKSAFLKTFENQTFPVDESLDALESLLDPGEFFRINRKFLVHMNAIRDMTAYSRGRIKLDLTPPDESPEDTVVSIERSVDFKKWMNS